MAGNQIGKTICGAAETAMHATGLYPDWWKGHRFDRPIRAWVAGVTNVTTRDAPQARLLGPFHEQGTGMIPASYLEKVTPARGIPEAVDFILTKSKFGGLSKISFKSYEQGVKTWQAATLDWTWFDEEPPQEIYNEGLARLTSTKGLAIITFTPLMGMSEVVRLFWPRPTVEHRGIVRAELEDSPYIDPVERDLIISRYPAHERDARIRGIPILGSGRVFDIEEALIAEPILDAPSHWPRIIGLDLGGGTHPTAFVLCAWDRDIDCLHVLDTYRSVEPKIALHAAAIRSRGTWIPVAWPRDAWQHDRTAGIHFATVYQNEGCSMLTTHAQFADGSVSLEAGVAEMGLRMSEGRLKVAGHLSQWFEEYRTYHRKDGKIVAEHDDLLAATRYAMMMIRFSRTKAPVGRVQSRSAMQYDPFQRRPA